MNTTAGMPSLQERLATFWDRHWWHPRECDVDLNISHLGDSVVTRGAIDWLGIKRFDTAGPIVIERIRERARDNGWIGGTANHTVMCSSALLHLAEPGPVVDRASDVRCRVQEADGASWPGGTHSRAGFRDAGWYEARGCTTAHACESLALYLRAENA